MKRTGLILSFLMITSLISCYSNEISGFYYGFDINDDKSLKPKFCIVSKQGTEKSNKYRRYLLSTAKGDDAGYELSGIDEHDMILNDDNTTEITINKNTNQIIIDKWKENDSHQ